MAIQQIRIQFKTVYELLDISRESLRHIVRNDASFPKPIKMGTTKQAPVYFDYADLMAWHESQKTSIQEEV